jgi:hypothetical protein
VACLCWVGWSKTKPRRRTGGYDVYLRMYEVTNAGEGTKFRLWIFLKLPLKRKIQLLKQRKNVNLLSRKFKNMETIRTLPLSVHRNLLHFHLRRRLVCNQRRTMQFNFLSFCTISYLFLLLAGIWKRTLLETRTEAEGFSFTYTMQTCVYLQYATIVVEHILYTDRKRNG